MNRTSTSRSLLDPRALFTGAALTTLLFTSSGCGSIGEGPKGAVESDVAPSTPADDDGGNNGGAANGAASETPPPDNGPPNVPCEEVKLAAKEVVKTNCAGCHNAAGGGQSLGGFGKVLDAVALVQSGKIVPNDPAGSLIYQRMTSNDRPMPPDASASAQDVATMKDWILCGAEDWDGSSGSLAQMTVNERLSVMRADLRDPNITDAADRPDIRYIDFAALSSAGYNAAQIDEFKDGASLVLNSLSYANRARRLEEVEGGKGLIYKINIEDYGWDAADWDRLVEDYPYIVQYNEDSEKFPYEEQFAEELREQTGTVAPYIQADWLIAHASQPPLYYDMLEVSGKTLDEIAADLGIDIQANIMAGQIDRSGFTISGVSEQNRMIERHEIPGEDGAFWLSYDFITNIGNENLEVNPLTREEFLRIDPTSTLGFQEAGGEVIYNLPNGLQAYLIVDVQGNLLDEVPNDVATDPNSQTREVIGAVSCMGCHANGIIEKSDTIRNLYLNGQSGSGAIAEAVLRTYPTEAQMNRLYDSDNEVYQTARATAGIVKLGELSMSKMVNGHERSMNLNQVAAVLGITSNELRGSLNNLDGAAQIFNSLKEGGVVSREVFEANFGILVEEVLALGNALDTRNVNN